MNILITSCSKKVLLVKNFKTHLNNLGGILYTTDIDIKSPALYFADDFFISPISDCDNYIDFLIDKCKKLNIKLIIPTSCKELQIFSINKPTFENIGIKVMICSLATLEICQNKQKFIEFCLINNFPIPITYNNKDNIRTLPIFIKPNCGSGSSGTLKINDIKYLNTIDFSNNIIQEFVDWKEYTIDYLSDFNGNYINCVARERINIINGESCVSKIVINETITNLCKLLGEKLQLIGHNTIQCFSNENEVKFIEINPRFGGACNLGIQAGLESPQILLNLLYGKKINIKTIKNDMLMLRYSNDLLGYINDNQLQLDFLNETNRIFCFDIDGTLCSENCKYEKAMPIHKIINIINKLFNNKNKIILFTSRGYTSGFDWRALTEKQLLEWGVKYHELILKKPYADYYIDNKAIHAFDCL